MNKRVLWGLCALLGLNGTVLAAGNWSPENKKACEKAIDTNHLGILFQYAENLLPGVPGYRLEP